MRALTLYVHAEASAMSRTRREAWTDLVSAEAIKARVLRSVGKPLAPPYGIEFVIFKVRPTDPSVPWPERPDLGALVDATVQGLAQGRLIEGIGNVVSLRATSCATLTQPRVHITVRSHAADYPSRSQ